MPLFAEVVDASVIVFGYFDYFAGLVLLEFCSCVILRLLPGLGL